MNHVDEFDEIEKELKKAQPFIKRPDALDIHSGTLCWLDGSRVCGADCVAFNADELDDDGVALDTPNKCLPLVYLGQQGSAALSIIAANKLRKKKEEDLVRAALSTPPLPPERGRKP